MRLVVALQAQGLEVAPVQPPLPAVLRLNGVHVVNLHGELAAFLAAVVSVLHAGLGHALPIRRGIEPQVLGVELTVVACVALLDSLLPLRFNSRRAGIAVSLWVWNQFAASAAGFQEQVSFPLARSGLSVLTRGIVRGNAEIQNTLALTLPVYETTFKAFHP